MTDDFAAEVDAFAAHRADDAFAFISGQFFGREFYRDGLHVEEAQSPQLQDETDALAANAKDAAQSLSAL